MSTHRTANSVTGTQGDDDLAGTAGTDRIYGLAGDDVIQGLAGADGLWGGPGRDLVQGQEGDDYLSGGPGPDIANGGPGDDMAAGWADGDVLLGFGGEDWVIGHDGDDFADGGLGDDRLDGGSGDNAVFGRAGDDWLIAGGGNDRLYGDGPSLDLVETLVGPEPEPMTDPFWQAFALGPDVLVALTPGAPEITLLDVETGERVGSLQPPPGVAPFDFNTTLATGGDRVLVGEAGADTDGEDSGRAHLYDTEGRFITTVESPDPAALSYFGQETAVGTGVVAVAEIEASPGSGVGRSVHLYDSGTGAYRTSLEFPGGPNLQVNDLSLAADGTTLAVGVSYSDFGTSATYGAVYLYDGQTGDLQQTIEMPAGIDGRYFATDIAISGDRVLVGSPNEGDTGRAYLFDASSGELVRTIEHPAPDPDYNTFFPGNFGAAVALTGERIAIGDQQSSVGKSQAGGAVYVFDAEGENLLEILTESDPAASSGFGAAVAAVGTTVAVSSSSSLGPVPGAIHLYRTEPDGAGGDDFLYAGAGDDLLLGGAGNDLLFGADGDDTLDGGAGDDWIAGGRGDDALTGGDGRDGFTFGPNWGRDEITDLAEGDRVFFRGAGIDGLADLGLGDVGGDAVLSLGASTLTLRGVAAAGLQEDWFFFA